MLELVKHSATMTGSEVRIIKKGWYTHEQGEQGLMNFNGERLGEEICQVVSTSSPLNDELSLAHTIANPMKAHINGLAAFGFDRVRGDAHSTFVVAQQECGVLRVTQVRQGVAKVGTTLRGEKQTSVLSFGGG